jgi:Fe-Mn family superoxide dismutase
MSYSIEQVELPPLPWNFDGLEPHISAQINKLHYLNHHKAYVDGYNNSTKLLAQAAERKNLAEVVVQQKNIKFFGGGHINHSLFWKNLSPTNDHGGRLPSLESPLGSQVVKQYQSFENLIEAINKQLAAIQGSGWVFLVKNINGKTLDIVSTANQDTVTPPYVPLIAIDAWEHAYYLQYQNVKANYFAAIWNVINWHEAELRYESS